MTTYKVFTKANEKVWLYSDATFTLALSDCANPAKAAGTVETTPAMLAYIFTAETLRGLLRSMESDHAERLISIHELEAAREGKLGQAIALAAAQGVR